MTTKTRIRPRLLFISAFAICSALAVPLGAHAQWLHDVPGAVSDVPVAPGTSPTSWYTTPEDVQHIAYVGTDQSIHELFLFIRRPCDIYASAGTPCVAAHSTTRALYAADSGPLYQVRRSSDGSIQDVGVFTAGDYANAVEQDSFCANTSCIITRIYDQSPRRNDLTIEGAGGNGEADVGAPADALPVTAGGHQVYGVSISAGMGYRNNATSGVAVNG